MKFNVKIVATITLLFLFALNIQAQSVPLYGCLQGTRTFADLTNRKITVSSGVRELDNMLVEDITALDYNFGVNVPIYFLDDGKDNAFFTPTKFPDLIRADGGDPYGNVTGSVFLGVTLLVNEFKKNGSAMTLPAIVGHEVAHAKQYSNRFPYRGKWRELHADLMAGWFVALRGEHRPQDVGQAAFALYNRGDFDFFSEDHHGTPDERGTAFVTGYLLYREKRLSAAQAYSVGIEIMKQAGAK